MAEGRGLERFLFPGSSELDRRKLLHQLKGKTVLITGGSSGIGEQLAYLLSDAEAHLILVARREERLIAVKSALASKPARISLVPADIRNEQEMEWLLQYLHQLPEGLDIVVSNAGHSIRRPVFESLDRLHDFTRTMAINYVGPVQLLLSVLPLLERNKGHIINVSTINTLLPPLPFWSAYQASKSAFDTWLRSAAPELYARGIAVSSVYLPLVRTPMIEPTVAYRKAPAMRTQQAAAIIGRMLYTRRRVYKPWWVMFGQWGGLLLRGCWERAASRWIRRRG